MKKKLAVFTGAGISKESGIPTFRDKIDGLWYNYKVEDVATIEGWKKDRSKVLEFHNLIRKQIKDVEPNDAHKLLKKLEDTYEVTVITQNIDNIHEKAGSSNILHLHGELTKARSCLYNHKTSSFDEIIDIGYDDINIGDKCLKTGSQLRPHTVLFGEYPYNVNEAYKAIKDCDILIIIGTSLEIGYTLTLLREAKPTTEIYFIDPQPVKYLDSYGFIVNYIEKKATEGMRELYEKLMK